MDVMEVAPPYDHAEVTAMAAHRCVLETISGMAYRATATGRTSEAHATTLADVTSSAERTSPIGRTAKPATVRPAAPGRGADAATGLVPAGRPR